MAALSCNGVPAEWITPTSASADRVLLYLHGGAYCVGSAKTHRRLAASLAIAARSSALVIDYRLAPEHPFPAALDDAMTAYLWLLDHHYAPADIYLAGDSAGGGLLLALLMQLRDQMEPLPGGAVCLSPWADLTGSGSSWHRNAQSDLILNASWLSDAASKYLGPVDPHHPLASPLFGDMTGLPPMLVQVSADEILLSDALEIAARANAAGVAVHLEIWDGMQHVWQFATPFVPEARQAIARIAEFILSLDRSGERTARGHVCGQDDVSAAQ